MTTDAAKLAALRVLAAPLRDMPPRRRPLWRVWLWIMESRYRAAEKVWGRERARVYDYIPF